jgi:hypothetical protein
VTTREDVEAWIKEGRRKKATHLVVVCDSFSYEDYPVFVSKNENLHDILRKYNGPNMQRLMEVIEL